MKKTNLSLAVAGLMLASAIVVASCKKKDTTTTPVTTDTSTTSTTDNNTAQQHSNDITNIGSQGIENNGSLSTYRSSAGGGLNSVMNASVTINVGARNMTVTFDGTAGLDGHIRKGTLHYDWNSSPSNVTWYRDSGLVLNVTTPNNDYSVDGYTVNITSKQIQNKGRIGGQLTWTDNSNITVLKPASTGGGTIQWQANWSIALLNTSNYTYVAPDGTTTSGHIYPGVFFGYGGTTAIDWSHALIAVSSTSFSGTASDGETYTGNISASSPLILNLNCTPLFGTTKYLYVSGILNFTPTGKTTRVVNYGNGACDLTYVVSIGSYSLTITI